MRKNRKITARDQQTAAAILTLFMFCETMDDVHREWKNIYEAFGLCDDPFFWISLHYGGIFAKINWNTKNRS